MDLLTNDRLLFLLFAAFLAFTLYRQLAGKVAPDKARALVGEGARLVDVRTSGEFAGGHIAGAVNVPLHELESRIAELGEKVRPVVGFFVRGMRSAKASRLLKRAGFAEVHDLGAMARWG